MHFHMILFVIFVFYLHDIQYVIPRHDVWNVKKWKMDEIEVIDSIEIHMYRRHLCINVKVLVSSDDMVH